MTEIIEGRIKRKWLTSRFYFMMKVKIFCKTHLKHLLFHLSFAYKSMSYMEISFDLKNIFIVLMLLTPFCIETTTKVELSNFSNTH